MLELKQITKTYETGGDVVHALKGVNLSFRENEFVSILGQSGCGKTTLLNIMGGLDQYSTGDLIINGVSTKKYKDADWDVYRNHSIGFVFQSYNLIPHQTVLANVELALTLSGVSSEERRRRAVKALTDVGLGDQLNKKPAQMSGGQMQRVAIARALINNPDILLADEPTGALDSETSVQIMGLLKEIAKDKLVIMVTHNPELAKEYSTRIVKLSDGLVVGDSNPLKPISESSKPSLKERIKNKSMSFKTAIQLSLNNLMTKKARTILTAFAGSIGIIGIALILSVSNGFQKYIDKLEEDTLSSYPLTIESSTMDMSSLLAAFAGDDEEDEDSEKKDNKKDTTKKTNGIIKEKPVLADSFSSMGTNDLASLKKHIDSKANKINSWFNFYEYKYGIRPQIYATNMKYGVFRVSPDTLMENYKTSLSSNFMTTDAFQEMIDNQELLSSQYKVVAGKWPKKYDELVLVLQDDDTMMDYLSYALGLRNPKEYKKMMNKLTQGKEIKTKNKPLKWKYKNLLNLEFSLVRAGDIYRNNSEYNVWEDMSDNNTYMKNLIKNGEKLHITGIVSPKEKNSSTVMATGVYYLPSLTRHVMDEAAKTDIVKIQKVNNKIDVFSGKSFTSIKNGEKEDIGLDNLFSIDEAKLKQAFGGNVDQNKIKKMVIDNTTKSLEDANPKKIAKIAKFIATQTGTYIGKINQTLLTPLSLEYNITNSNINDAYIKNKYSGQYAKAVNGLLKLYCKKLKTLTPISGTVEEIPNIFLQATADVLTEENIGYYSEQIVLQSVAQKVPVAMGQVATDMGKSFQVDPSLIQSAFKMNMDEKELQRLMMAYMSGDEETSYDENLRKLGYANINKPTNMTFYLRDFESKEKFINFIESYNKKMQKNGEENKVISYTDLTGTMMKSVKTITNAVSYVLIAFVAISLVVSSIMIGVITYISVLERTKEIGILRAIGASKKDISRIFNAETILVGLCAGLIGIGTSLLLIIPINKILLNLTKIASLRAALPVSGAIILIFISMFLTYVAGLIPSRIASKKDPVVALRTE